MLRPRTAALLLLLASGLALAAAAADKDAFLAAYGRGYTRLQAKEFAAARAEFEAALAAARAHAEKGPTLVRLGQCLEGEEKWAEAVAAYLQAAACPREDKPADQLRQQRHVADALKRAADLQQRQLKDRAAERETLRLCLRFTDLSPAERAGYHLRIADGLGAEQDTAAARTELAAALDIPGLDANRVCDLRLALGEQWRRENRLEDALAEFARVAEWPDAPPHRTADARLRSAELLVRPPLNRTDEARAAFAAVLDNAAARPDQRLNAAVRLGEVLQQQKEYAAARAAYARALEIADGPPARRADALYKSGECWLAEGNAGEARAAFERVLDASAAHANTTKAAQTQIERLNTAEPKP